MLTKIWTIIRFLIIGILSLVYWPLNMLFLLLKKHYFNWKETDKFSFIIATPLYIFLFLVTAIISMPMEALGDAAHPPLGTFR